MCFQIKTTSPDKYRVRPSMSNLGPGKSNSIEIHVQASAVGWPGQLVRDKFLVTAVTVDQEGMSHSQITEVMKVCFLSCLFPPAAVFVLFSGCFLPPIGRTAP